MTARDNLARQQIYIPAAKPEDVITLRVAAYCRVSTDSDDQINSFVAQNHHYSELISSHDKWELVDIYADEGITGTSIKKRDDFQRMLNDCRKGRIDKILVKSISRFARNTTDCLETIRELKAMGISVFFEEHNIDTTMVSSEMLTAVLASCAQVESESISKNMRWAVQKRMQHGTYIASSAPYGYRLLEDELIIHQAEASVVRRIFEAYLAGQTPPEIATQLICEGNSDREWRESTIKYILRNERYTGSVIFQKTYTTETLPFQRKINKGQFAKYLVRDTNPAIITQETFDSVQNLIAARFKLRDSKPGKLPLSGCVVCGRCGAPVVVRSNKGKQYLSCRTHDYGAELCGMMPTRAVAVYAAFQRLYYNLKHNTEVLTYHLKNLQKIRNRQILWRPEVVDLNQQIFDITSQSHALTLLNKQGMVDPDIFISKSNQLAEQLRKAKQQKERLQNMEDDKIIEITQQMLEVLSEGPALLESFDEELFCELIDRIIVESNTRIRFRLKNGLELPEFIERTVR